MILYSVDNGKYISPRPPKIYVNLTNLCNNACEFCLRNLKTTGLWLENDPTADEIISEIKMSNFTKVEEVIICGYGEPTCRLPEMLEVLKFVKNNYKVKTRLNTNGLGSLENGRDISSDFKNLLDVVSISLNASNAEKYFEITKSQFGLSAYPAMLDFAEKMKSICEVVMTVVDVVTPPDEIELCKKICAERGLKFRLRVYEGA